MSTSLSPSPPSSACETSSNHSSSPKMEVNCPVKQEDGDNPYSQLHTMPSLPPFPYPDQLKSEETLFGDWSFSNASSQNASMNADDFTQSQHSVTCVTAPPTSLLSYDQLNADLSSNLTLEPTTPTSTSSMPSSEPFKVPLSHIPRPPNAFMLYRSDFLKRGIIPAHVERRQQNLSRIAGQCWNLLPPEEKAQWQERAAQVLLEHQTRNPDYKFTPAPRGSRRLKVKGRSDNDEDVVDGEERIRQIRERYARIAGPTVPPARRRRPRGQNRNRDLDATPARITPLSTQVPLPLSMPPSPCPSISSPEIDTTRNTPLPPFFPHHTIPHIIPPRRPSTSLGFATECSVRDGTSLRTGLTMARPSSAASDTNLSLYMKDLSITPTVPTFNGNSSPVSLVSAVQPTANSDLFLSGPPALQDELIFPTLNPLPATASADVLSAPSNIDSESFLGSLYSDDAFVFNLPIVPAEEVFHPLQNSYVFDYEPSFFQSSWSSLDTTFSGHMRSYTM